MKGKIVENIVALFWLALIIFVAWFAVNKLDSGTFITIAFIGLLILVFLAGVEYGSDMERMKHRNIDDLDKILKK